MKGRMKEKNERKEILQQEEKNAFEKKTSKTAGAEKKRKEKTNAQRKKRHPRRIKKTPSGCEVKEIEEERERAATPRTNMA